MDKLLSSIPSLGQDQSVAEWRKLYEPATALLTEVQRVSLLPCYVNRTKGQLEIAQICAKEASLEEALVKLADLLEGGSSRVDLFNNFFNVNTASDPTSLFFELKATGNAAGIANYVIFLRFCGLIPGGRKFYDQNKAEIDVGINDAKLLQLYTRIQRTFSKEKPTKPVTVKEEVFQEVFPVNVAEQAAPPMKWIKELKHEIIEGVLQHLNDSPPAYSGDSDSSSNKSVYKYREARSRKSPVRKNTLKCELCGKSGHSDDKCFKRKCENCEGFGHPADKCPTVQRRKRRDPGKKRA